MYELDRHTFINYKKATMYNKKLKKFIKKPQPNSGFTLTELLTGLFMSIFVTGALGFGLYQIMSATAREKAKSDARNEASRAVEFISDELRRAQTIEVDASNANSAVRTFDPTVETVVLALNIPEINSGQLVDNNGDGTTGMLGSDGNATTSERVVYYLKNSSGNWQGPQVLYRWGPPLNANGQYTEGDWQEEALIDGIDDTVVTTNPCDTSIGEVLTTASAKGFYACLTDDDRDGVDETETTDTNGNGVIDDDDIDGSGITAQIFLTGGIDTIPGKKDNYTAQTRAVARAKNANVDDAEATANAANTMRSLEADFICNPPDETWTMRMDFDTDPYDGDVNNAVKWIHEEGRQSQPIDIGLNDLTIYSSPIVNPSCLSNGNEGATAADDLSTLATNVSYSIRFQKSLGDNPPRPNDSNFWKTFNGDNSDNSYNNPNVDPTGKVIVLKNGSVLDPNVTEIDTTSDVASAPLYGGYDYDNNSETENRPSLGNFLVDRGLAYADGDTFVIDGLDPDQRIIAFEIGQEDNGFTTTDENGNTIPTHPGFDLQDNVIVMRHNVFDDDHGSDDSNDQDSNESNITETIENTVGDSLPNYQ